MPFAQWEGTYINAWECIGIYTAVCLLLFAFINKKKYLLHTSLLIFILLLGIRNIHKINTYREDKLTVHAIPKTAAISVKHKNQLYLLGDSAFISNADQRKFHINRYAYSQFVPKAYIHPVKNTSAFTGNLFYFDPPFGAFANQTFLLLNKRNSFLPNQVKEKKFSFIILSGNVRLRIAELKPKVAFEKIILAADNSFYRNDAWEKECKDLGIDCINLQKDYSFALTNKNF